MRRSIAILAGIIALCLCSCGKPVKESAYCNIDPETGWIEPVTLSLELTDTISPTQLDLCLQIAKYNQQSCEYIPMIIDIESPLGQKYTDTLQLPLQVLREKGIYDSHNGYTTLQIPYRKNVITRVPGEWFFTFIPVSPNMAITRIGISCKKEIEQ